MRQFISRLRAVLHRRQLHDELVAEMAVHRAMMQDDLEARGASTEQAVIATRRRFGSAALACDQAHDVWIWPWLADFAQDVRFGGRQFVKDRWFALTGIATLAVGIAAVTVMFALVEGVLLRPLPVGRQDRLVVAWTRLPSTGFAHWPFRVGDVETITASSTTLEHVAGVGHTGAGPMATVEEGQASYVNVVSVTGGFFDVLDVQPSLGRFLTPADDVTGAEKVMVITHGLWRRRYGGQASAIGRRIVIGEQPFTIVGVMPADVAYPHHVEAWITITAHTAILTNPAFRVDVDLLARLRPATTIDQAVAELKSLTPRLETDAGDGIPSGLVPVVRPFTEAVVGEVRPAMLVLFAAVGLVMLVAIANTANLLLLRTEARRSELALRSALGAGRSRLGRQLMTEGLMLAVAAGAVGLTVAPVMLTVLVTLIPGGLPRAEAVRVDAGVIVFATVVMFLAAALAGLTTTWRAGRLTLMCDLKNAAVGSPGRSGQRIRRALVVAQIVLAVTVVAAAGLLVRSLARLQAVDMGMAADRLVFVELTLPHSKYGDRTRHLRFLDDLTARFTAIPRIAAATPVNVAPFSGTGGWDLPRFTADGQSEERAAMNPSLNLESIHPTYFDTFEVALVRGRRFTTDDREHTVPVAILSEDAAARTWPGEDPIGKRFKFGGLSATDPWRTVVGVVRSTRYRELVDARATLYLPAEQFIVAARMMVLRTTLPAASIAAIARAQVEAVDPGVSIMRVASFADLLAEPLARPRFNTYLLTGFGALALMMATIGLYAVVSASVRRRDAEFGVRMALGATAPEIRRLAMAEGLWLAGIGTGIGLSCAVMTNRILRGLLFGVGPLDPVTLVAAALLLVAVAILACYLPAARATRLDPIAMLRAQ
jgi:putative ABC transport system permease protein